jgi:hypothetical protein
VTKGLRSKRRSFNSKNPYPSQFPGVFGATVPTLVQMVRVYMYNCVYHDFNMMQRSFFVLRVWLNIILH